MLIGYARVSTLDQHLDLQLDALKQAGCEKIFTDKLSGAKADRPGLQEALAYLRPGDALVFWKLDRLTRSLHDLLTIFDTVKARGADFKSLQDQIDTTTPVGKFTFHVLGSLGEFVRDIIRENTRAGLAAARARGRLGGAPRVLSPQREQEAVALLHQGKTLGEVAMIFNVSKKTIERTEKRLKNTPAPADRPR